MDCISFKEEPENFILFSVQGQIKCGSNIETKYCSPNFFPNAKPFLKWAGGKTQLLNEIEKYYPFNKYKITKFAEPFIGGGAVLFDILNKFDLESVYISDLNIDLINTYLAIQKEVGKVIELLKFMQEEYWALDNLARKKYYNHKRDKFNALKIDEKHLINVEKAALLIFLNKTCFNGLFRVNKKGLFNVPMGSYKKPLICDEKNLNAVSQKLKKVNIVWGDYKKSKTFIDEKTFVYFDPPYRPLTSTSNFTAYTENDFNDEHQKELAYFVEELNTKGAYILVSNSEPKNSEEEDIFFEKLYASYFIDVVEANRMINSKSSARGKIKELLISNFERESL